MNYQYIELHFLIVLEYKILNEVSIYCIFVKFIVYYLVPIAKIITLVLVNN